MALPRLGEHPDVDGDKDDRYKVIDAAVLIGANSRRIFPTHGHLPKRIRVTVSGSGKQTVTVKLVTYVSKGHAKSTHRALTRTYRIPPCGGSVQSSGTTMSGHRPD